MERFFKSIFQSFQLSAIIDLLEGSFYGLDLLKLHSVTKKLVDRVEHIEKVESALTWLMHQTNECEMWTLWL